MIQVFFFSVRNKSMSFGPIFAPYQPDYKKDERWGCVHHLYAAKGDCPAQKQNFACARYLKLPILYDGSKLEKIYKEKA